MCLGIKQHCEDSGQTNQVQYMRRYWFVGFIVGNIGVVKEIVQMIHFSAVM